MNSSSLLLCTDMDGTVIPDGRYPENPRALDFFREFCALPEVSLAYVSGRHLQLIEEAVAEYQLPQADYLISDVGAHIYCPEQGHWQELESWHELLNRSWQGWSHDRLAGLLSGEARMRLQEEAKQSRFKISYYVDLSDPPEELLQRVQNQLDELEVEARLTWSVDSVERVGLLDILPASANKRHAIEFLQQYLQATPEQVLFAGDGGNDLPVLVSPIRSVLVANADTEVKEQALAEATQADLRQQLYIARDDRTSLGGYYAAGVLQGIDHFCPALYRRMAGPN